MVKYITYQEKQLPIRITFNTLYKAGAESGKDFTEDFMHYELFEPLLWYSLRAGHYATGQKLEYKRDDMEFMLDDCLQNFIKLIPEFFPEAEKQGAGPLPEKVKKKG